MKKPAHSSIAQQGARGRDNVESRMVRHATEICGSDAPTAVACAGLDAWFEDDKDEFELWVRVFKRLRN